MSARPFVVPVARLRQTVGSRRHELRQGSIEGLDCSGSAVAPDALVVADVTLESAVGGIAVTGTVSAPWTGECRRCLEPASGVIEVPVRELYTRGGDDEETYPLHDDEVDLEPLVHDTVLLELPQAPLCRPDCLGLCPTCGANRNLDPCDCAAPRDPRWAALDALATPTEPLAGTAGADDRSEAEGRRLAPQGARPGRRRRRTG